MVDTTNLRAGEQPAQQAETEAERAGRLVHERALLDEAREDVRTGRVIADENVDAWLERFVRGKSLPLPETPPSSHAG